MKGVNKGQPGPQKRKLLQSLPSVEWVLRHLSREPGPWEGVPREELVYAVREVLSSLREEILGAGESELSGLEPKRSIWVERVKGILQERLGPSLRRVINATGVVIHTNLGRSLLPQQAVEAACQAACRYTNLEFDLFTGQRGSRYVHVERPLCGLTGAEAAMVVNNNAAAVLLCLQTLARGKEVIVSRGELVEIGGAFRMPDVMRQSGAVLREVGTTNKTKLKDYECAICPDTALLLKVHTSNYRIVGFTHEVPLEELVSLGMRYNVPVMMDLGSGALVDLQALGQDRDPTVQQTVASGADLVTFSGDKLLGGPQAGIILGRRDLIDALRGNPLARALRIDKLTLSALEATLRLYWEPGEALRRVPTLHMLHVPARVLRSRAYSLARRLRETCASGLHARVFPERSQVGGGSMPLADLPTWVVGLRMDGVSASRLEASFRRTDPAVISRILKDEVVLDLRTVLKDEIAPLLSAVREAVGEISKQLKE